MIVRRYSKRTIQSYIQWTKAFINFHNKTHPSELDNSHVEQFLSYLAIERHVSTSTQKTALNAIAFLYNKFLKQPLADLTDFKRVKRQAKLPTVLTESEVKALLTALNPKYKLMIGILYGSGLRLMELIRLRVHDIDLDLQQIRIWNAKGFKHRFTTLAPELIPAIKR